MGAENLNPKTNTQVLLESLCVHEEVISLVCRKSGLKFVTRFHKKVDFNKEVFYLQYPKNQELFNLEKSLKTDGEIYSTVKIGEQIWVINFSFIKMDETGIQCKMPAVSQVNEVNRRQSLRFKPSPTAVEFKVFLADYGRTIPTEIVDVSTGGLSFSVPMGMKSLFAQEKLFRDCPIKVNHQLFSVNARIRNMFYQGSKIKVGISFENAPPSLLSEIQILIKLGKK